VAAWRLASLPMRLSDEQLEQVLVSLNANASCCGLRDRAIVVCLATLGLRPGEVAELRLDDIDWRAATVEVGQRKNRRSAVLPLPREAGEAIVAYLRGQRPQTDHRQVFVQHIGPRRGEPITASAVSEVVARVLRRAGVQAPMVGAYVLRHTVASRMVQRGVSLKEVADFLGHRSLDTTAIYAKVDLPALHAVALPWPEAAR
jgi:integrase/recombinase XerD